MALLLCAVREWKSLIWRCGSTLAIGGIGCNGGGNGWPNSFRKYSSEKCDRTRNLYRDDNSRPQSEHIVCGKLSFRFTYWIFFLLFIYQNNYLHTLTSSPKQMDIILCRSIVSIIASWSTTISWGSGNIELKRTPSSMGRFRHSRQMALKSRRPILNSILCSGVALIGGGSNPAEAVGQSQSAK